jgi:hypothetical protein
MVTEPAATAGKLAGSSAAGRQKKGDGLWMIKPATLPKVPGKR